MAKCFNMEVIYSGNTRKVDFEKETGAGLDVFKNEPHIRSEFFELDNVVLSPHIGTAEEDTRDKMGILAAKNIIEVLEGREALTKVN
ncbi:MAG: hypothetical protein JJE49_03880 [Peptostreptococcaceae bacterium]|nr:hypothetical protein [Peptostreptococcaceae bacterium]